MKKLKKLNKNYMIIWQNIKNFYFQKLTNGLNKIQTLNHKVTILIFLNYFYKDVKTILFIVII
jgi:hypothetical protein